MERKSEKGLVVVCGSGKKIGKTFLCCSIIRKFSVEQDIIALKISPHVHDNRGNVELVAEGNGFRIFRELDIHEKNSGKFLAAGAAFSYFMEASDQFLPEAYDIFRNKCNDRNLPVICESGALGKLVKPSLMFFVNENDKELNQWKKSLMELADIIITAITYNPEDIIGKIRLREGFWESV